MTTDYVLDGQSVVRTFRNGAVDRTWLHGPRGPEYERDAAGNVVWYLYDGLGSVIGTVDPAGNIVSTRKYDVYGAVRGSTGPAGPKHRFVGAPAHPSEEETGLIYMRARYYDPVTGRFVSEDPLGEGRNVLIYAGDNPVSAVDFDGCETLAEGEEAWTAGLEVEGQGGGAVSACYRYLTGRIAQATGRENVKIALELLAENPVPWSAGEYQFLRDTATLLIRMNGNLPKGEIARTFCREIPEFLQRNEAGGVLTRDVWEKFGPELHKELMSFF